MKFLLDTHAFLWFSLNDSRLSREWSAIIQDGRNEKLISDASLWELAIKSGLGKLQLEAPFEQFIERNLLLNGMSLLHASLQHFATVQKLPQHHRDPFDRLIIAQCMVEQIPVMTTDPQFERYDITLIR